MIRAEGKGGNMARKRKKGEIQTAIREVMQNNVIDLALRETRQDSSRFRQSDRLFLYLEILNTSPAICHVFDMKEPVKIGRDERENNICIQDRAISRRQACIWQHGNSLYLSDMNAQNSTGLKRGFYKLWLSGGQTVQLRTGDTLLLDSIRIRVRIFRGENEISR